MPDHQTGAPRGGFVISLDFELMWGVRDNKTIADYGANILGVGQTVTEFRADLAAACTAAKAIGITLESIVFPRNQFNAGYLDACRSAGLIAWRGNERGRMYRAEAQSAEGLAKRGVRLVDAYLNLSGANGSRPAARGDMADVPSSRFLRPWSARLAALEPLRLRRILGAMRRAAARGEVFHLWFHPHNFGVNQDRNFAVLERIAVEAVRLRDRHGWPSLTMAKAARRALAA